MTLALIVLGLMLVLSLVSFAAYGWDKRCSTLGNRRIPERNLHLLAVFGGWPGALVGQRYFRHKTKKLPFRVLFWITVLGHLVLVGVVGSIIWGSGTVS